VSRAVGGFPSPVLEEKDLNLAQKLPQPGFLFSSVGTGKQWSGLFFFFFWSGGVGREAEGKGSAHLFSLFHPLTGDRPP
jgi:hypothetical protein